MMTATNAIVYAVIVILGVAAFAVGACLLSESSEHFKDECTAIGGKPLHDGRQWQCLKPSEYQK